MIIIRVFMNVGILCNVLGYSGGSECYVMDLVCGLYECVICFVFFVKMVDKVFFEYCQVKVVVLFMCKLFGKLNDYVFGWLVCYLVKWEYIDLMIGCNCIGVFDIVICGGMYVGYFKSFFKEVVFWDC